MCNKLKFITNAGYFDRRGSLPFSRQSMSFAMPFLFPGILISEVRYILIHTNLFNRVRITMPAHLTAKRQLSYSVFIKLVFFDPHPNPRGCKI